VSGFGKNSWYYETRNETKKRSGNILVKRL
jgi:hypothetical protein